MAAAETFAEGLRSLGFTPELRGGDLVVFDYEIEVGPLSGETVKIGLHVPGDWPMTPPSGPIVAPRILPLHPGQEIGHPYGGVHDNPELGSEGHYLSRPFPGWPQTDRSVCAYLGHIRHLFDTLPDDLQRSTDD
jgi:hypothetical protein